MEWAVLVQTTSFYSVFLTGHLFFFVCLSSTIFPQGCIQYDDHNYETARRP